MLIYSLHVSPHLQVLDEQKQPIEGVFAIGDNSTPGDGNRLPATAQVAGQMATYLGKALNKTSSISELVSQPGFTWKNRGSMVFIGDKNVCPPSRYVADEQAMVDASKASGFRARFAGYV